MASGIKVDSECVEAYQSFKMGKSDAFFIMGFSDDFKSIKVKHVEKINSARGDSVTDKNLPWKTLIELLPRDDVAYVVADVHFFLNGTPKSDIVFITWAPENSTIKKRMLLASSTLSLKRILDGVKVSIQAGSYPDLELINVVEKFKGKLQ